MDIEHAQTHNRTVIFVEGLSCIFVEGLSCSGKTTILKTLSQQDVAPIFKNWPVDLKNPTTEFFLRSDEDKLTRAKRSSYSVTVVDRGYLSTLTFYSVMEEQRGISAYPVYRWFIENMGQTLYRPSHYVFIDIPPEQSIQRAQTANKVVDEVNMWLQFPDRIEFWYNKLLAVFEYNVPVHRINGSKPLEQVTEEFNRILQELKKGL